VSDSRITIAPCESPPITNAQPGLWWYYQVTTHSGRSECCGYTPGTRVQAERVARGHLAHMESLEGAQASLLTIIETQRVAKHSEATPWRKWSSHERDPDIHDELCRCRRCSLGREKNRFYKAMNGTGDVKRRQRKRKARA
jgi:hypothetical protein